MLKRRRSASAPASDPGLGSTDIDQLRAALREARAEAVAARDAEESAKTELQEMRERAAEASSVYLSVWNDLQHKLVEAELTAALKPHHAGRPRRSSVSLGPRASPDAEEPCAMETGDDAAAADGEVDLEVELEQARRRAAELERELVKARDTIEELQHQVAAVSDAGQETISALESRVADLRKMLTEARTQLKQQQQS